jgi:hypothetical protein
MGLNVFRAFDVYFWTLAKHLDGVDEAECKEQGNGDRLEVSAAEARLELANGGEGELSAETEG